MLDITVSNLDTFGTCPNGSPKEAAFVSPYHFADLTLRFPETVLGLSHYSGEAEVKKRRLSFLYDEGEITIPETTTKIYSGSAPFAGRVRKLQALQERRNVYLVLDEIPYCCVDLERSHIHLFNSDAYDAPLNLEVITGPALLILMAESDRYCLHAGAVRIGAINVAFIAESGVGKSTLSKSAGNQWQQLADDIVPIGVQGSHGVMRSFPQLKRRDNACGMPNNEAIPLNAVVRLSPEPADEVQLEPMRQRDALLQLVRHTVGIKLFSQHTLSRHLDLANELSNRVPVIELRYPRKMNQLEKVRRAVTDYLG